MSKTQKFKIIIAIVMISFLQGLQHSVTPVLGAIADTYPAVSTSFVQMLVSGPGLLAMVVALISGVLVTKISKKKLLLFAAAIGVLTGFLPLLFDSFWLLFVCRMIYGMTLGLAMCLNTAVVAEFFEGDERVQVMGIQGASVGAGMMLVNLGAGMLGAGNFRNASWINLIAVLAFVLLLLFLPDTGRAVSDRREKIRLNRDVYIMAGIGFFFFMFLITFTTNISMHLGGALAGSSRVSGILTAAFSIIQIFMGIVLGGVTKALKRFTMAAALFSFTIGALLLVLFPSTFAWLLIGALFCGICQGIMMPSGMVEVANAVNPVSQTMASAVFSCGVNLGSFLSPVLLNAAAKAVTGEATTGHVYLISAVGMALLAAFSVLYQLKLKRGLK